MRSGLVIIEIAASIILLVGASLLVRSLNAMLDADLGVTTENVLAAQMDVSLGRVISGPRLIEMMAEIRSRVAAIPSIREAGYGCGLPPAGEYMRVSFALNNRANPEGASHIVTSVPASPDYFSVLQIPMIAGRRFGNLDTAEAPPVGILNRQAAAQFFGQDDPIGQSLPFEAGAITIIGVVENVKYTGIGTPTEGVLYRPFSQQPFRLATLVVRTDRDPIRASAAVREAIHSYDAQINVINVQPLTAWISDSVAQPRFRTLLVTLIAGIALVLAMVGLYGVVAYSTSQRTSEIGVRVAVGAQRSDIARLVLGEGARLALVGILIGSAGAYWSARLLASFLYGVTTSDPVAFAISAVALFMVAMAATYLPARRAARIDPMIALRAE
jgi:putative ABC transport system permease protein